MDEPITDGTIPAAAPKTTESDVSESLLDQILKAPVIERKENQNLIEFFEDTSSTEILDEAKATQMFGDRLPKKEDREMVLKLKVGHAGIINGNGRYYPVPLMENRIKGLADKIKNRRLFGNDQHPRREKTSEGTMKMIDQPRWATTCFIPLDLTMNKGGEIYSHVVVPKTDAGRNFAAIVRAGGNPGISTRGGGSVERKKITVMGEEKEVDVIQDDYRLITYDSVIDQSVQDAGIRAILESLESDEHKPKQERQIMAKKFKDWSESNKVAYDELIESLKGGLVTLPEIEALNKDLAESLKKVASSAIEEKVRKELSEAFDEFCTSVRDDIKDEELSFARAEGVAVLLKELGLDEETAGKLLDKPKQLTEALKEAVSKILTGSKDEPAAKKDESTPPDLTKQLNEALENHPVIKSLKKSLDEANEAAEEATKKATDLDESLIKERKTSAINAIKAEFPYGKEVLEKVVPLLEACETADEVKTVYENQLGVLQTAGAKQVTPASRSRFLATDSATADEAARAEEQANTDPVKSMLDEAAADIQTTEAVNS